MPSYDGTPHPGERHGYACRLATRNELTVRAIARMPSYDGTACAKKSWHIFISHFAPGIKG